MAKPAPRTLFIGALVVAAAVAAGGWWLLGSSDQPDSDDGQTFSFNPFRSTDPAADDPTDADDDRNAAADGGGSADVSDDRPGRRADSIKLTDQAADQAERPEPPDRPTTIIRLPDGGVAEVPSDSPAALAAQAGDGANEAAAAARDGIGPGQWAAPISPEEEAEIQAAFDAIPPRDPRVTPRDRRSSIEVARVVVEDCFRALQQRHPGRRGRVAVAWTASADRGVGRIDDPEITLNLKLRESLFEQCIVQGLDGLTFPAEDQGEPRRVEYPFFFDQ